MKQRISIPDDFTKYTGLRYKSLTPGSSGEEFRDELLIPALDTFGSVTVVLDGNIGEYVPSFLEECFGGLIRAKRLSLEEFHKRIQIISDNDPLLLKDIDHYVTVETSK